jgi:outer membrane lipoprotein-sorting protein
MSGCNRTRFGAVAALIASLWACGTDVGPVVQPELRRLESVRQPAPALDDRMVSPDARRQEGEFLLRGVRARTLGLNAMDANVQCYTQGYYNDGKRGSELRHTTSEIKMVWSKPTKLRIDMLKTNRAIAEGAQLVTVDGQTFRIRAKGLLGLIPFSLPASHPGLNSNRNHTITEEAPLAHLQRLTAAGAQWTVMSSSVISGTPVTLVEVTNIKHLDADITREVVGIDPQQMALRRLIMYAQNTRVSEHLITRVRLNGTVASSTFTL